MVAAPPPGLGFYGLITRKPEIKTIKESKTKIRRTGLMVTTLALKKRTRIGCWNVRTMYEGGKMEEVRREMQRYNIEILGLSETRWTGFGEKRQKEGDTILYSGREEGEAHLEGVAIMMSKQARKGLIEWRPISERIMLARFRTKVRPITIIQCYAPTETATEEEKDLFYQLLHRTFSSVKKRDIKILMGDLNAKLGNDNRGRERTMGKQGLGVINDNGERFAEFCNNRDMVIGGTLFPHKNCHKVTWASPDLRTENQIDHICVDRSWRKSLLDVRNRRGADVGSDHHLVVATIQLKIAAINVKTGGVQKRFNIARLKIEDTKNQYNVELANRFSLLQEDEGHNNRVEDEPEENKIEEEWLRCKNNIKGVAEEVLGFQDRKRQEWITERTWDRILERREKKQVLNGAKTREQKEKAQREYSIINKEVKRSTRNDKRAYFNLLATNAQKAGELGDLKTLYQITKKLSNKRSFADSKPIKNDAGMLLTMEEDQLKRWRQYFVDLLNRTAGLEETKVGAEANWEVDSAIEVHPPTEPEIAEAIRQLKNGKAAGEDNIACELLKADPDAMANYLHPLLVKIWEKEKIPEDWKKGLLIKIPKKGNLADCENWRGITLLSVPSKILCRIILNRIRVVIDGKLRREQSGFRAGRSCTEQINTLRIIVEQCAEFHMTLYLLFVDFEKAFDNVEREAIWEGMKTFGIPPKIINLVKELYNGYKCQVIHRGKLSEPFEVQTGVKQGCLLSPLLFLLVLDIVLKKVTSRPRGLQWTLTERLEDLDFADDICMLSQSFRDMQDKLNDVRTEGEKAGLKINSIKTKEMRVNSLSQENLHINDQTVERVSAFCYLGSTVTETGGAEEDVKNRIRKAQNAFSQLWTVWKSKDIRTGTKIRIFDSNVKSVLLYGCETWKVSAGVTKRLQTFLNRCLRNILRIWWPERISNSELWQRTRQDSVATTIRKRKWTWLGHALRRERGNIARESLEWNPQGQRRRGRPRETWRRTLEREMRSARVTWQQVKALARDRDGWRNFVEALCSTPRN